MNRDANASSESYLQSDLIDEEWSQIQIALVPRTQSPGRGKRGRPLRNDRRTLVNAIFYVVRAGLRMAAPAQRRIWPLADCLWLLSPVEPGLDLDVHPLLTRCAIGLRYTEGRKGGPDGGHY